MVVDIGRLHLHVVGQACRVGGLVVLLRRLLLEEGGDVAREFGRTGKQLDGIFNHALERMENVVILASVLLLSCVGVANVKAGGVSAGWAREEEELVPVFVSF